MQELSLPSRVVVFSSSLTLTEKLLQHLVLKYINADLLDFQEQSFANVHESTQNKAIFPLDTLNAFLPP